MSKRNKKKNTCFSTSDPVVMRQRADAMKPTHHRLFAKLAIRLNDEKFASSAIEVMDFEANGMDWGVLSSNQEYRVELEKMLSTATRMLQGEED